MKKLLNKKGFTLIELIVVIAILAILALILVPSITNYIGQATDSRNTANARSLYTEITLQVATSTNPTGQGSVSGPDNMRCNYTVTGGQVTVFTCTANNKTYALPDFKPSN